MRWHKSSGTTQPSKPKSGQAQIAAGVAMVIAALLAIWVLIEDNESSQSATAATSTEPAIVNVTALRRAANEEATPIYWAGRTEGSNLELSRPSADRTYVRYLPSGVQAGDSRPFLTVGSYRFDNPTSALHARGGEAGGVLATAPGGGVVYFERADPKSVYLAYPDTEVEVEVFAPEFKEALQLVTDGRIVPVE